MNPTKKIRNYNVAQSNSSFYSNYELASRKKCGIPDSIEWGDYRIFLYEEGVKAELRRKDSIINSWRDSVRQSLNTKIK